MRTPTSPSIGGRSVSYRENIQDPRKRETCSRVPCTLVGMAIELRSMASGFVVEAFINKVCHEHASQCSPGWPICNTTTFISSCRVMHEAKGCTVTDPSILKWTFPKNCFWKAIGKWVLRNFSIFTRFTNRQRLHSRRTIPRGLFPTTRVLIVVLTGTYDRRGTVSCLLRCV